MSANAGFIHAIKGLLADCDRLISRTEIAVKEYPELSWSLGSLRKSKRRLEKQLAEAEART